MGRHFLFNIILSLSVLSGAESSWAQGTNPNGEMSSSGATRSADAAAKPNPIASMALAMPKSEWVLDLQLQQKIWEKLLDEKKTTLASLEAASSKELQDLSAALQKKQPRAQLIQTSVAFAHASLYRAALLQTIQEVQQGVLVFPGREKEATNLPTVKETPEALRLRATNIYRRLVTEYGKTPELEGAVLELCQQLTRQRNDNAEFYFREYFRAYQETPLAKRALLAYGDFLMQKGKLDQAFASYKVVINDKKSDLYPYALLRYSWAAMMQAMPATGKDKDTAWKRTELGLKVALKQLPPLGPKAKPSDYNMMHEGFRREVLRALALMYGERAQLQEAQKFFAENSAAEWLGVAKERLADRYAPYPQTKADALRLYTDLGQDTTFVRFPFAKLKSLELLGEKGDWANIQKQVTELQTFLTQVFPVWQITAKRSGEDPTEVAKRFEDVLHRLVLMQLEQQQKSDGKASAQNSLVTLFEQQFPQSEFQDEIALQKAIVALQRGDLKAGTEGLEKFIGLQMEMTPLLKEAAMRRVLAYDQWLKQLPQPELPAIGKAKQPLPFPVEQKNFLKALDFYADAYPDDPSAPLFRKVAAFSYLSFGYYDKALQRYEDLAYQYPESAVSKESLETIFGVLIEREQWQTVVAKAENYLSSKRMASIGLRRKLRESVQYAKEQLQQSKGDGQPAQEGVQQGQQTQSVAE